MRILLATGLRLMDEAMANYIEANSPAKVEICADAVDIASRLRNGLAADFIILDCDGLSQPRAEVIMKLKESRSETRILLLKTFVSPETAESLVTAGASAVLPKSLGGECLLDALSLVRTGATPRYVSEDPEPRPAASPALTRRETALLAQLCAGRSNKEIAVCFGLREGTVKSFARSICQKLGARNRRHLVMLAEQGALV
ncbi:response regulator transcription factor [Albidovulum sp.]|uniref:response regulator transcription factor n=2 Tax=Albidovulum sp. TaxID=1872424 RepID=UPI001DBF85A6|nr:response regulator transcription factor [Paracoccaceae bacterium]HPE25761.1 response regulator transcription factor [Albidovulum sp.]MCB2119841.1 response regulator transcription factor [Paracoccaceae bacterium]MCB2122811.1 response regulator transcription factor [Paracoccaceae bacterium]MCB2141011.1 response regulator transcription factor [Paracoccaceae bacterium]